MECFNFGICKQYRLCYSPIPQIYPIIVLAFVAPLGYFFCQFWKYKRPARFLEELWETLCSILGPNKGIPDSILRSNSVIVSDFAYTRENTPTISCVHAFLLRDTGSPSCSRHIWDIFWINCIVCKIVAGVSYVALIGTGSLAVYLSWLIRLLLDTYYV